MTCSRLALQIPWKDQGSRQLLESWAPIYYLYRTHMMSYPTQSNIESIRNASTSIRIQHRWNWCPKLFHLQCGLDAVSVHPANEQHEYISVIMRITRVPNSAAISRCDIIVMSAIGTHHRDNFLGWLMFISCRCLVYWTCCACSSWWYLDWEAVCCWRDRSWWSLCQHVAWVHDPCIDGCNNNRWPNDTTC